MHELSIAQGIVDAVVEALPGAEARVTRVFARVGALSGVVPEALAFAWDVATRGSPIAGALLEVERVPASVYCDACDRVQPLEDPTDLRCPRCGILTPDLRAGRELEIHAFELDDAVEETA